MLKNFKVFFFIVFSSLVFAQTDYQIGPEDVLIIHVYEEEDLSIEVRVSSDGYITYPLLGRVQAVGLTVYEVEQKLVDLLAKDYLVNPQVTVFVKEYSSIYVLGEVHKPGPYNLVPNTTLMKAISMAGGLTEFADQDRILVIRKVENKKNVFEISLSEITEEGLKEKDIKLNPTDVIQVKRYENIYVLGQVNKPGEYVLKEELSVVESISLAGGFTKIAASNKVRVIRKEKGMQHVVEVPVADILKSGNTDKDVILKPNDVVMIPESFF